MSGATIMIIRHAEKPSGSIKGYTGPDGKTVDSHSLTLQGWARAAGLVQLFNPLGKKLRPGILTPTHVFCADGVNAGERMKQTGSLLAASLGITPVIKFDKGKEKDLAKALLALPASAVALVIWEHSMIPAIVKALGSASPKPPKKWDSKRFDVIWKFTSGGKAFAFTQVPELVLPTDSGKPIKLSLLQRLFG